METIEFEDRPENLLLSVELCLDIHFRDGGRLGKYEPISWRTDQDLVSPRSTKTSKESVNSFI